MDKDEQIERLTRQVKAVQKLLAASEAELHRLRANPGQAVRAYATLVDFSEVSTRMIPNTAQEPAEWSLRNPAEPLQEVTCLPADADSHSVGHLFLQ